MAYASLRLTFEGSVATLTVDRPEVRNALDTATVAEFHAALDEIGGRRAVVLIVTGAGERAFVSGADIRSIRERRRDDALASINSRLMSAVESHDAVTIAAVNGYALGAGASWPSRATCASRPIPPSSASRSRRSGSSPAPGARSGCRGSWASDARRR